MWVSQKGSGKKWRQLEALKQEGVELMKFEDILAKILDAVNQWRKNMEDEPSSHPFQQTYGS